MNKLDIQKLQKLMDELRKLRDSSHRREQTIIDNGRIMSEEYRAMSAGYAGGYDYCILRLKMMFKELR